MRVKELAFRHTRKGSVHYAQDCPCGFVHVYNSAPCAEFRALNLHLRLPTRAAVIFKCTRRKSQS